MMMMVMMMMIMMLLMMMMMMVMMMMMMMMMMMRMITLRRMMERMIAWMLRKMSRGLMMLTMMGSKGRFTGTRPQAQSKLHLRRALCARLCSRNAYGHLTRALSCGRLQAKSAPETHMDVCQEPLYAGNWLVNGPRPRACQTRPAGFVRAPAIKIHMDMSQKQFDLLYDTSKKKEQEPGASTSIKHRPSLLPYETLSGSTDRKKIEGPATFDDHQSSTTNSRPPSAVTSVHAAPLENVFWKRLENLHPNCETLAAPCGMRQKRKISERDWVSQMNHTMHNHIYTYIYTTYCYTWYTTPVSTHHHQKGLVP